jgi:hypothetical protein
MMKGYMEMELSQWFDYQLRSTLDGFIWAVRQLPKERWYTTPPTPLGEWSAAQHAFHLFDYEERLALPTMYQWLGAPPVLPEESENQTRKSRPSIEELLPQFEKIRWSEIGLLPKFDDAAWATVRKTTFWGDVSLYWLVCKTYQHTVEHTHNVLGLTLFWDRVIEHKAHGR